MKEMKNAQVYVNGEALGNALKVTFPTIDTKPFKLALENFSGAVHSLSIKLENVKTRYWIGFDGSAQYYKELEQLKNRQLLPGTCIGEIK